jgi:hypothetical protein
VKNSRNSGEQKSTATPGKTPLAARAAERPDVRSHAERGNEKGGAFIGHIGFALCEDEAKASRGKTLDIAPLVQSHQISEDK